MMRLILSLAALLIAFPALAAKPWPEFRDIRAGEAFTPRADRAYLLMRVKKQRGMGESGPMWLRVPRTDEIAAYEKAKRKAYDKAGKKAGTYDDFAFQDGKMNNFYGFNLDRAVAKDANAWTVLIEAEPATYVLAGVGWQGSLGTCFCLGTVQFDAKAGEITDLGTFLMGLAADPSSEPELAPVTNLGSTARMDYNLMAGAIRPAEIGEIVPPAVSGMPRTLAQYHAVAPFILRPAFMSNFLAPLSGVLEYRRGEVFDARSGKVLR